MEYRNYQKRWKLFLMLQRDFLLIQVGVESSFLMDGINENIYANLKMIRGGYLIDIWENSKGVVPLRVFFLKK